MLNFKLGDRVVTDYRRDEKHIVRRVTGRGNSSLVEHGSGFWISADGGDKCPTCGRMPGTPIGPTDSAWFKPVKVGRKK